MEKHVITLVMAFVMILSIPTSAITIVIYAFDQNPAGNDEGNEWVALYNPSNTSINVSNWTLSTTHGTTVSIKIHRER